jgi:GT2 family glycosyltransferase
MKNKRVEIVTPVHNRRDLTLQCLKSLSRIDRTGLDIHIIIVDDGSTDGTSEAIRENYPEVEIIRGDGSLWYTAGTNLGIEAALKHNPDYVLCINDDGIFEDKCVRKMVECAEKYPRAVVGAILLLWDKPHQLFQTSPKWDYLTGGWRHWHKQTVWTIPKKPWEVDLIVGNCVMYPAQAIREVGLMNAKKLVQYGDAEYTPRMKKRGWRLLIEPQARVFCKPNNIAPKIRKMKFSELLNVLIFDIGHMHNIRRRLYLNLYSAPNKMQGFAAFCLFFLRLPFGKNPEQLFAKQEKEPPLSEIFSHAVVKD